MEFILAALSFGLVAGLKPGPLGVYVIHETISRGDKAGFLACLAPLVTDGPIILVTFAVLSYVREFDFVIAGISLVGAFYLLFLSVRLLGAHRINPVTGSGPSSFLTAIKLNFLNPAPWLFWGTVGGAYLIRGTVVQAIVFAIVMLSTLAISKFTLAKTLKTLGNRFHPDIYSYLLKILALVLVFFAFSLAYDSYNLIQSALLQIDDFCAG